MTLQRTAALAMLERMKALGVDYVFGNAGTDFPPIIEAFAQGARHGLDLPEPILAAHETVAVGMAHGYALATGRAQAAMVHVNVGLANSVMGLLNARADAAPMLLCSGRTPITEFGRHGSRSRPIHWGQDMRDQSAMVREAVKWDYELRFPEQAEIVIDRALAIAHSDPKGPVYLGLPREVLAQFTPEVAPLTTRQQAARVGIPPQQTIADAIALIRSAKSPLIVAQRPPDGSTAMAELAERFAIPVIDFWSSRNVIATSHPMFAGGDTREWLNEADLIITVEALAPWELVDAASANWGGKLIAIGADPLFSGTPIRSFPIDLALVGDAGLTLDALLEGLTPYVDEQAAVISSRRANATKRIAAQRAAADARALKGSGVRMNAAWVSKCLSDVKADDAVVFSELGVDPSVMNFAGPNLLFQTPLSGGLGYGLPAALGFQLADRKRQVISCMGDGSYIFANPIASHMAAVSLSLPVLTIVFNNGIWNAVKRATLAMYPKGEAAQSNLIPLTQLSPSPEYASLARAQGLWAERIDDGAKMADALARALEITRSGQPALLEVVVE